ncbi:MAG: hypothetical protein CL537_07790 [Alcanivoracaceae bacterium]|nr:hypothetical protein [Alcanivoracaceae bacterium]|tara:strand:- start:3759 stop:4169 length:411 start_codon:yes stop_codon:yes gene_type:complete
MDIDLNTTLWVIFSLIVGLAAGARFTKVADDAVVQRIGEVKKSEGYDIGWRDGYRASGRPLIRQSDSMKFGTAYRVKVLGNDGVLMDMDIHGLLMQMWYRGSLHEVQHLGEIQIEILRDEVPVEIRLPAWLEHEED